MAATSNTTTSMSDAGDVSNSNMSDAMPTMLATATINEYLSIYLVFASIASIPLFTATV
eukprot:CAMPEP_0168173000 /NCGR_PEP_ID=MMETSP0139_2-20121125/5611_1 /TAXON_ID=44445 /ORGANISM="Pseudo-nitzschia australis, Strain 10249 10 AB" /LENGTH=58 /DNA_ID=CAMNT_0008090803 /DNA_START=251 /DNA_END=427 /DNA_ORIENTATION=+